MEIKRAAIKKNAKLLIATTRPSPILVFLVYILIGLVLLYLSESISGETKMVQEMLLQYQAGNLEYVPEPPEFSGWACVLLIALSVMNYMLAVGTHIYSLEICQQRQGSFGNLFDGFGILHVNPLIPMRVLFQSKRYSESTAVSRSEVGDFRNAIMGRAEKGILFTTSRFSGEASKEAAREGVLPIELVDSERLVELMEDLKLGVVEKVVFDVDHEFFRQFMEIGRNK